MNRLEDLVINAASRAPGAVAIRDANGETTYAELHESAAHLAQSLDELGVEPGDRVGIWLHKSANAVAAMQAVLRLGAAYVPLDPEAPLERIRTIAASAGMKVIVTSERRREQLAQSDVVLLCIDRDGEATPARPMGEPASGERDTAPEPGDAPAQQNDPNALAYILYTSGSTGVPKGVCISHRNALAFIEWAQQEIDARESDRFGNHAPFHFDLSVLDLYVAFACRGSVSLVPGSIAYAPKRLVEFIERHQLSVWYSVPSALILMMEHGDLLENKNIGLRAICFAGEVFPIKQLRQLWKAMPEVRLLNLYGPTETNVCTYYEVDSIADDQLEPVPIGKACSGDRVWAQKPDGTRAEPGEEGELFVAGPTVMQGYFGQHPQGVRPYATGDIVRQREDGHYVYVGRRDHMVKVRGHRIELGEIEAALLASDQIRAATVVVRGEGMHARLRAYVVCDGSAPTLLQAKRLCAVRLPRYMIVDELRQLAELPRNRNGKVDRRRLHTLANAPVPPESGAREDPVRSSQLVSPAVEAVQ